MATISILSRIVNGVNRQVDLSTNTLLVQALSTGTNTLTDSILGNLLTLQNGTLSVPATLHAHDGIYTRTTALASAAAGSAGSTLIGDNNSYTHITPASATVKAALSALDAAVGASTTAIDTTFVIKNNTDNTKQIAFDASTIATGQTRTIHSANADVFLAQINSSIQQDGTRAFLADQSMGGFKLTNLSNGISAGDAVNYGQLQALANGLDWKQHVRAMADSNIALTGTQTIDGVSLIAGDRVLVQNQTTASANGIYVVASGAWARSSDASTAAQLTAATTYIDEGTAYKGSAWVQTASSITVGTTAITFVKIASILPLVFRNGLLQTGQNVDVVAGDNSLLSTANSLKVQLATGGALATGATGIGITLESTNPTLQINAGALGVKVDLSRGLNTNSNGIGVNVDGSTIAITSNVVGVKNAGISATQLATGAFDQTTITGGAGAAAAVQQAPALKRTLVAGQAFAANTTFAVRWANVNNGETAGRVYAADTTTTTYDLFYVIGLASSGTAVSAGQNIVVTSMGSYTLGSSDTPFTSAQQGYPLFLGASGAVTATAPTTAGTALVRIGMISTTTTIDVNPVPVAVN